MKRKFLAFTFLLSTSFQVMANDNAPYNGRQYIIKGIKLNRNIELTPINSGAAIISTVQVQALGSYFDGGIFDKDTIVFEGGGNKIKSRNSGTIWQTFHAHHLPVDFSYDLRRPQNGEIIDVKDDDGNLTLFALKRWLESAPEEKDKNKVMFFYRSLENRLNLKAPKKLDGYVYYPDIPQGTQQAVRISGYGTFINNQPLAGLSAQVLGDYRVQSILFNPLLATPKKPNSLDWLSKITIKINGLSLTLNDTDGFLTQASLKAWEKFEGESLKSRIIHPCIQAFDAITENSDPFAVAGRTYSFAIPAQEGPLKVLGNIAIDKPIVNENPSAGIEFRDAVTAVAPEGLSSYMNSSPISPLLARFFHLSKNQVAFFSFENNSLDRKSCFFDANPFTIRVNEPMSDIILKKLKGKDVSLTEEEIRITEKTPFELETGQVVDCKTQCFFGPLEKSTERFDIGHFIAYRACYTTPGLSVSMGPILHEDLYKTRRFIPDSWGSAANSKAVYHFDKLFLDKLNELAGNK